MLQPAPAVPFLESTVTAGGEKLAVANKVTYLGSTLLRQPPSMKRSTRELYVQVLLLADYKPVCEKEVVLDCKPN